MVTERVRDLLLRFAQNDIAICPVTFRKIGARSAMLEPQIPATGEPEDIIDEVPLLDDPPTAGPYFEIVVKHESGFPPGGTPGSVCSGCRRPAIGQNRQLRMTDDMWKGQHIFMMAATCYIIVTEDLRQAIESLCSTNVLFEKI